MNDNAFENQLKKIRELEQQTAQLEKEAQEIMDTLGVTREEIDLFFSNPENLTEHEQTFVEEQKKHFEFTFQHRTERLRTIDGLKKKYQDLHLSRHWIPMR